MCVCVRACVHSHVCYPSNIKHVTVRNRRHITHKNQSTDTMRLMSSAGSPTDVSTMIIVTRPALGIAAAPILAQVAVRLEHSNSNHSNTDVSNSTMAPILLLTIDHASLLTSNSCVSWFRFFIHQVLQQGTCEWVSEWVSECVSECVRACVCVYKHKHTNISKQQHWHTSTSNPFALTKQHPNGHTTARARTHARTHTHTLTHTHTP